MRSLGGLADKMGIELQDGSPEQVIATMPVAGNTQPYGLLHGGASAALAETVGSVAAMLHAERSGGAAVGVDLSITHLKAVRSGSVTATATALRLGRSIASYTVSITDEVGDLVASARLTCVLRQTPPASSTS